MSKSTRGARNLQMFNSTREKENLGVIRDTLAQCKRQRARFKTIGALAEYVGGISGIHRTTLLRNPRYEALLANHYFGNGSGKAVREGASTEELKARILALELENSNLKERLKRLDANLKKIEEDSKIDSSNVAEQDSSSDYVAFVDTAMALSALIERLQETIVVNLDKKTIEDMASRPSERIVVGPRRMGAYVRWLERQKGQRLEP